jgi:hypothetical protein
MRYNKKDLIEALTECIGRAKKDILARQTAIDEDLATIDLYNKKLAVAEALPEEWTSDGK